MVSGSYKGLTVNAVDAKNRLSIPADVRSLIEKKSASRELTLAPHPLGKPCLVGYDQPFLDQLVAEIALKYGTARTAEREEEMLMATGFAETLAFDDSGRIVLPADLRASVGIDKLVAFVGFGDTFQMWNPKTFREANKNNPVAMLRIDTALAARGA